MGLDFDSLNPYQNLEYVSGQTPDELLAMIKQFKTPIKIISIHSHRNRLVAFVMGDIRKKRGRPPKNKGLENG